MQERKRESWSKGERKVVAGQSHLDPIVHRATRGPTSPSSSCVPLRDPYTLQESSLLHPLPLRSGRYTGSCDPRRGKLSTLAPCERPSSVTSDICGPFDRQTALFPSRILPYCTSFLLLRGPLFLLDRGAIVSRAARRCFD